MNTTPTETPNVVIENPAVRKGIRLGLDIIGGLAFIAAGVDVVTPEFDISAITTPVLAGYGLARSVFGLAVDLPNTPSRDAAAKPVDATPDDVTPPSI